MSRIWTRFWATIQRRTRSCSMECTRAYSSFPRRQKSLYFAICALQRYLRKPWISLEATWHHQIFPLMKLSKVWLVWKTLCMHRCLHRQNSKSNPLCNSRWLRTSQNSQLWVSLSALMRSSKLRSTRVARKAASTYSIPLKSRLLIKGNSQAKKVPQKKTWQTAILASRANMHRYESRASTTSKKRRQPSTSTTSHPTSKATITTVAPFQRKQRRKKKGKKLTTGL